ncbi:MAG TPA: DUF4349 domain-containing protein [Candidatus Angelobacter sp.]|nr:DUF4349 domain-containing protein [Candidatus Angelobacter sp.]
MSKSIHPIEPEELMAYLDGELQADRATIAAAHLERCKDCQKIAADLRDISQRLMSWQVPPSDSQFPLGLAAALAGDGTKENAEKERSVTHRPRKTWRDILSKPRYWALGAVSAAAILAMISVFVPNHLRYKMARFTDRAGESQQMSQAQITKTLKEQGVDEVGSSSSRSDELAMDRYAPSLSKAPPRTPAPQPTHESPQTANLTGPMIVRTAELALVTADFDQARKSMEDTLKHHHGYFGNLNTGGAADAGRSLDAVLRVPADQLDLALAELKKLGRVESESQKGDEVTQQYVDLQARLTNARNTEQRLTDLLRQRTGRLSDVLEVEEQIDAVRERIEQMDAEKKNLANQVAFATLSLKMREDFKAHVQMVPPSTSSRIRNAAVEGYETMVSGLIAIALFLVSWGPSLLLWSIILFFPARAIWRRVRRPQIEV